MMFEARRLLTRWHRVAAALAPASSAFALVVTLVGFAGAASGSATISVPSGRAIQTLLGRKP